MRATTLPSGTERPTGQGQTQLLLQLPGLACFIFRFLRRPLSHIEAIVYAGGKLFDAQNGEKLPYKLITFRQR